MTSLSTESNASFRPMSLFPSNNFCIVHQFIWKGCSGAGRGGEERNYKCPQSLIPGSDSGCIRNVNSGFCDVKQTWCSFKSPLIVVLAEYDCLVLRVPRNHIIDFMNDGCYFVVKYQCDKWFF